MLIVKYPVKGTRSQLECKKGLLYGKLVVSVKKAQWNQFLSACFPREKPKTTCKNLALKTSFLKTSFNWISQESPTLTSCEHTRAFAMLLILLWSSLSYENDFRVHSYLGTNCSSTFDQFSSAEGRNQWKLKRWVQFRRPCNTSQAEIIGFWKFRAIFLQNYFAIWIQKSRDIDKFH